jgi:hypothetical protein
MAKDGVLKRPAASTASEKVASLGKKVESLGKKVDILCGDVGKTVQIHRESAARESNAIAQLAVNRTLVDEKQIELLEKDKQILSLKGNLLAKQLEVERTQALLYCSVQRQYHYKSRYQGMLDAAHGAPMAATPPFAERPPWVPDGFPSCEADHSGPNAVQ